LVLSTVCLDGQARLLLFQKVALPNQCFIFHARKAPYSFRFRQDGFGRADTLFASSVATPVWSLVYSCIHPSGRHFAPIVTTEVSNPGFSEKDLSAKTNARRKPAHKIYDFARITKNCC
jgi:hypothetical protein